METPLKIKKRRVEEDEETRESMLPPAKRYTSSRASVKKPARTTLKKAPGGHPVTCAFAALPPVPQEPEVIDLSIEVVHKPTARPSKHFPRFKDGDVLIDLGNIGIKSTYQFHSRVLGRVSPWFDTTLTQPLKDLDAAVASNYTKATGIYARYELHYHSDLNIYVLARTTLTQVKRPKEVPPVMRPLSTQCPSPKNPAETIQSDIHQPNFQSSPTRPLAHCSQSASTNNTSSEVPSNASFSPELQKSTESPHDVTITPEVKREEPEIKEEQPELKNEEPEVKDEEPEFKDEEPEFKDEEPEVKGEESEVKEEEPETKKEEHFPKSDATSKENAVATEKQIVTPASQGVAKEKAVFVEHIPATSPSAELSAAYHNLFLVYYGKAPIIDASDIRVALRQVESLIRVAELYGSIPIVRPYLGNCMMQFGRDVYSAILQDPPRWLQLSLYLESTPIFKEAIIHIVGNLPNWPWTTVQLRDFPDDLTGPDGIFERKLNDLESLQRDVDRKLIMSSIKINGEEAKLDPENKKTFNTWLVVQLWKNWFIRSVSKDNSLQSMTCSNGTVYRLISKGADAYLPSESIVAEIKALRDLNRMVKGDRHAIEEDLKLMKEFAQNEVRQLCVNNSMLSVEEAGFEHLTCIKVETDEVPWAKKDGF